MTNQGGETPVTEPDTSAEPDLSAKSDVERHDVEAVNKKGVRSLYKSRVKIHPKRVFGTFRSLKWWIMAVTLGIYYITPWLRWDRPGSAPDQAVLIDFMSQRFYFFFIEIWPQEVYYIAGLLIMAGFGLFLITSMIGRAWCGYFCPQTVWTDLFLVIERAIEGDRAARIRLDKSPMSVQKIAKRISKHTAWLLVSMVTGGAWVFYYADAPTLFIELFTLQASSVAYGTVGVLTFTTYALGGLMREQVCIYMCPWPRIQAVMMDEESLTVTYQNSRGEPRGAYRKGEAWDNRGDCVSCNACVVSCPTGIDIRDGQQLECITCALCIDACDTVMQKVGRPKGLIKYDSIANLNKKAKGESLPNNGKIQFLRPRTILYFIAWTSVGLLMLGALLTRSDLDVNVLRDRNPLFTTLSDGSINNGYTLKILNKKHEERTFAIFVDGMPDLKVKLMGFDYINHIGRVLATVPSDTLQSYRIIISAPPSSLASSSEDLRFHIQDTSSRSLAIYDSVFRGPEK